MSEEAVAAPATGRGRPRPETTVTRDAQVLEYLTANGPKTRKEIAEGTELKPNEVYLSLYRLSRADPPKIQRAGSAWKTPSTEPAPAA